MTPHIRVVGAENLNAGIFGTSLGEASIAATTPEAFAAAAGGLNFGGVATQAGYGATQATGILGGASIGSIASAAGAGYGIGSFAGGLVQNAAGKTGYGPQIGAGLGTAAGMTAAAVAGYAAAPFTFGLSAVLGGAIGGVTGGIIRNRSTKACPPSPSISNRKAQR